MPTTKYPPEAYIRILHDYGVRYTMGEGGLLHSPHLLNPEGLASAVARPKAVAFGRSLHKGLARKAAVLFHALIENHPFADGNKRTAVLTVQRFLFANARVLVASDNDMIRLALSVADRQGRPHDELVRALEKSFAQLTMPFSRLGSGAKEAQFKRAAHEMRAIMDLPEEELTKAYRELLVSKYGSEKTWESG